MFGGAQGGSAGKVIAYPASKFLHIPCHGKSGDTVLPYTTHNGAGSLAIEDSWSDNRVNPTGSNAIAINDQRFDDIFNLATLNGGLLMMFTIIYSAAPSAKEVIFQYGADSRTAPGGIIIDINATNLKCVVYPSDNTVASALAQKSPAAALNNPMPVCVFIDTVNDLVVLAVNNQWQSANASTLIADIKNNGKLVGGTSNAFAMSLLGSVNGAGAVDGSILNSGTGNVSFGDFWAVRFENDMLTNIPGIYREYSKKPRTILRSLEGK